MTTPTPTGRSMAAGQPPTLERLQYRINELPLLPAVVVAVLQLDPRADDYFEKVVALVNGDPAFTARLLRYANSAFVGASRPAVSVRDALMRVGAKGAVDLIVAHSAARIFLPRLDWERDLWNHTILVACLMRELAQHSGASRIDADEAHTFGLLHDIGRFVLYLEAPESLRAVEETAWQSPQAMIEAEAAVCGFTHTELGFMTLRKWQFPVPLALAVRHHHATDAQLVAGLPPAMLPLVRQLRAADWLAVKIGRCNDDWTAIGREDLRGILSAPKAPQCHADPGQALACCAAAIEHAMGMRAALGLNASAG